MNKMETLHQYWQKKCTNKKEPHPFFRKIDLHKRRDKHVKEIGVSGRKMSETTDEIDYQLHIKFLIQDQETYYHEEEVETHRAFIDHQKRIHDRVITRQKIENIRPVHVTSYEEVPRFSYDRRKAVQYAERWWNNANPTYRYFEDNDCTNYISQCLRAGGAPMWGAPNRSRGWWYNDESWSYSWSVANAFRWYLSGSNVGLKGKELDHASDLLPGDVICYDFQGDGRWDHNTIVVAKDHENMPLVNAHTNNSRHRYWTYEDSAAWTPECEYRFFRIGEE
ncbi:hypothetical protein J416_09604 [Gracilibacillus halophilus YIM-C55.5]|uniref:Putative amidase domain-containing protein n=1 Tax=Gracilibacillus halophilus YIM-C55.5 TaxID=1308866 RepID=N4WKE9_9BACI|nr:amidase domain-containing protein [Gracilibacillus halophilus]ENH96622.1 hypothetical protein J416_09604 [Gracilibacillus halophilus YIM-C55.5]